MYSIIDKCDRNQYRLCLDLLHFVVQKLKTFITRQKNEKLIENHSFPALCNFHCFFYYRLLINKLADPSSYSKPIYLHKYLFHVLLNTCTLV